MRFVKVKNQDDINNVIESQRNLKKNIDDRSLNQRLKLKVMEDAINKENEITDIKEKILFNENLDEINKKREEEGLEPLEPKPLETSLQKEQIARRGLEIDVMKLSVKKIGKMINDKITDIKRLKRQAQMNPDDYDDEERDMQIQELRRELQRTLMNPKAMENIEEIEESVSKENVSEFENIMKEIDDFLMETGAEMNPENKIEYDPEEVDKFLEEISQYKDEEDEDDITEYVESMKDELELEENESESMKVIKSRMYSHMKEIESYEKQINDVLEEYDKDHPVAKKKLYELEQKLNQAERDLETFKKLKESKAKQKKKAEPKVKTQEGSGIKQGSDKLFDDTTQFKFKVNKNTGEFGKVRIDMNELNNNLKLVVYKNNRRVISRKVTEDMIDLLTKKYNAKKQYSKQSLELFDKVLELSEIRPKLLRKKQNLIGGSILYYTPDEMIKELNKITSKKSVSQINKNKGMALLDKLLELEVIDKETHKQIYFNYFQ